jgi:Flp pilus assembly protein TadG
MTATSRTTPARHGALSGDDDNDRGAISLELAILFPALLLVVFTAIQAALWYHARSLALAAAQEGVRAARAEDSSLGAGRAAAQAFLDRAAADTLLDTTVSTAGSGPAEVRVRVTGRAISVFPGVPGPGVAQESRGAVERFTSPGRP